MIAVWFHEAGPFVSEHRKLPTGRRWSDAAGRRFVRQPAELQAHGD